MTRNRLGWYTFANGSPGRHAAALLSVAVLAAGGGAAFDADGSVASSGSIGSVVVGAVVVVGAAPELTAAVWLFGVVDEHEQSATNTTRTKTRRTVRRAAGVPAMNPSSRR
jgi:hypothetical protein